MKVLLKLSSKLFSEGLAEILKREREITVLNGEGRRNNGDVDLVVVDINSLNSLSVPRSGKSKVVLIDTGLRKDEIVSAIMSHKLSGIINPTTNMELFKKALRIVKNGQIWVDNETLKFFMRESGKGNNIIETDFSDMEKKIIEYVCKGRTNKEIAKHLSIGEQTVKTYLNRIFKKLGISNRVQILSLFASRRRQSQAN